VAPDPLFLSNDFTAMFSTLAHDLHYLPPSAVSLDHRGPLSEVPITKLPLLPLPPPHMTA